MEKPRAYDYIFIDAFLYFLGADQEGECKFLLLSDSLDKQLTDCRYLMQEWAEDRLVETSGPW